MVKYSVKQVCISSQMYIRCSSSFQRQAIVSTMKKTLSRLSRSLWVRPGKRFCPINQSIEKNNRFQIVVRNTYVRSEQTEADVTSTSTPVFPKARRVSRIYKIEKVQAHKNRESKRPMKYPRKSWQACLARKDMKGLWRDLSKSLQEGEKPSVAEYKKIVQELSYRGRPELAFQVYRHLSSHPGYILNAAVHRQLIMACAKWNEFDLALEGLEGYKVAGHPPNATLYTALVNNLARHANRTHWRAGGRTALEVWQEMYSLSLNSSGDGGLEMDTAAFNAGVAAAGAAKDAKAGKRIVDALVANSVETTYATSASQSATSDNPTVTAESSSTSRSSSGHAHSQRYEATSSVENLSDMDGDAVTPEASFRSGSTVQSSLPSSTSASSSSTSSDKSAPRSTSSSSSTKRAKKGSPSLFRTSNLKLDTLNKSKGLDSNSSPHSTFSPKIEPSASSSTSPNSSTSRLSDGSSLVEGKFPNEVPKENFDGEFLRSDDATVSVSGSGVVSRVEHLEECDRRGSASAMHVSMGVGATAATFNTLITIHGNENNPNAVESTLERMWSLGITPDSHTAACVVRALCGRGVPGSTSRALRAAQAVRGRAGKVGDQAYTGLVQGYAKEGQLARAMELIYEMRAVEGVTPTRATYGVVVHAACQAGMLSQARQVIGKMVKEDSLAPNLAMFNMLVQGYYQRGELEECFKVLAEMLTAGVRPSVMTYNTIMAACVKKGDAHGCASLFGQLVEKVQPNEYSYQLLMRAFQIRRNTPAVLRIFQHMKTDSKVNVGEAEYQVVLESVMGARLVNMGTREVVAEMRAQNVPRTKAMYGSGLRVALKKNDVRSAIELLDCACEDKVPVSTGLCMKVAGMCLARDRPRDLERLIEQMTELDIPLPALVLPHHSSSSSSSQLGSKSRRPAFRKKVSPPETESRSKSADIERIKFWFGMPNNYYDYTDE